MTRLKEIEKIGGIDEIDGIEHPSLA